MFDEQGGLSISGKWINKITGDVINVRSNIIDGDNMYIISDHGQMSMEEFSNNYIQASNEVYNLDGSIKEENSPFDAKSVFEPINTVESQNNTTNVIEQPVIKPEPIFASQVNTEEVKINTSPSDNYLLSKVFEKYKYKPVIKINLDETDENSKLPIDALKMITDIYNISVEDIVNYIWDAYLVKSNVIKESLTSVISDKLK